MEGTADKTTPTWGGPSAHRDLSFKHSFPGEQEIRNYNGFPD